MRSKILFLYILLQTVALSTSAQFYFERMNTVPLKRNTSTLSAAWAGGLNAPQFSVIDLNMDGVLDLLVFDRTTNSTLTFLNKGTANTIDYSYAPEYERFFPPAVNWCITADFDKDGRYDLFSCSNGGIRVYRNTSSSAKLSFQLYTQELKADYGSFKTGLYVNNTDIPALIDVDKDGDMDVLTFELGTGSGDAMYYFLNQSIEKRGKADTLDMVLQETCWGRFREDPFSCAVALDSCTGAKPISGQTPDTAARSMHTGSTVTALDMNGDSLVDLLIGDISCSSMYLLTNGGTLTDARMVSETINYPIDHPIALQVFPAAFQIDVNNDGKKDLIVSPNAKYNGNNTSNCWLYLNTGTEQHPVFTFQTDRFLQDQEIDVGEGAYPVAVDVDADGKQDLLIGNVGYSVGNGVYTPGFMYLRNTGTISAPAFEFITDDWGNLKGETFKNKGWNALYASFADLDKDGDLDMAMGDREKSLHLFYNQAAAGNPIDLEFNSALYSYQNIDVGQFSTPFLVDANKDGKVDVIIGEQQGNLNYFVNQSSGSPDFQLLKDTLGKIKLDPKNSSNAFVSTWMGDWDGNGDLELIASRSDGYLFLLDVPNDDLSLPFVKIDSFASNMGNRISFTVADWNNDGKKDLAISSYRGGLALFQQATKVGVEEQELPLSLRVYPNPTTGQLFIENASSKKISIQLSDVLGRVVLQESISSGRSELDLEILPQGLYILSGLGIRSQLILKE